MQVPHWREIKPKRGKALAVSSGVFDDKFPYYVCVSGWHFGFHDTNQFGVA
jgi:hypothetical protein